MKFSGTATALLFVAALATNPIDAQTSGPGVMATAPPATAAPAQTVTGERTGSNWIPLGLFGLLGLAGLAGLMGRSTTSR